MKNFTLNPPPEEVENAAIEDKLFGIFQHFSDEKWRKNVFVHLDWTKLVNFATAGMIFTAIQRVEYQKIPGMPTRKQILMKLINEKSSVEARVKFLTTFWFDSSDNVSDLKILFDLLVKILIFEMWEFFKGKG